MASSATVTCRQWSRFRAPADEPEQVGQGQTHDEGQNGAEIVQRGAPVALGQVDAEEQNVAGLGVGKDMVAAHIGVGVHKAAAERQHDAQLDGFAHLLGDAFHDWNYHAFFCSDFASPILPHPRFFGKRGGIFVAR